MPKLNYFMIAESISSDAIRKTVSFFHVLERLTSSAEPHTMSLTAVSQWMFDEDDQGQAFQTTLVVRMPGGKRYPEEGGEFAVNFTAGGTGCRVTHGLESLPIEEPGEAVFEVLLNGQVKGQYAVRIAAEEE